MLTSKFTHSKIFSRKTLFRWKSDDSNFELPPAEKAKAIMRSRISGTFTTISWSNNIKEATPLFGSVIPFATHDRWYGNPLFALNKDGQHYKNIVEVQNSSFLIFPLTPKNIPPAEVPLPRVNLVGSVKTIDLEEDQKLVLDTFEKILPGSSELLSHNTELYEFIVQGVHYQKSSGNVDIIDPEEFRTCKEDAIAKYSRPLIEEANQGYLPQLKKICLKYGEIEPVECFIFGLDEKGFDVLSKGEDLKWAQLRFPWDSPITNIKDYQSNFINFLNDKSK